MKACPRIITFETRNVSGPTTRWCARFWAGGFLPMIFDGFTEDAVIDVAREWWRAEAAKDEARRERMRKAGLKRWAA